MVQDKSKSDIEKSVNTGDEIDNAEVVENTELKGLTKAELDRKAKNKKKKKNRRFAGNGYSMNLSLLWDEDHNEKINAICGFRLTENEVRSDHLFVGDVSAEMTIYTLV